MDDEDYYRFIHTLYEFNDESPVVNVKYHFNPVTMNERPPQGSRERRPRKLLVEILLFTLMPNHFHLLLRQRENNGIVKFMQKLGTGYTMYFNQKYQRVGGLFQGRFKAIHIDREVHFTYLPHYIHSNPLSLNYGGSPSIAFLENYRWSSFPDYIGKKNFPSATKRGFLLNIFGGEKKYKELTRELLNDDSKERTVESIQDIILE